MRIRKITTKFCHWCQVEPKPSKRSEIKCRVVGALWSPELAANHVVGGSVPGLCPQDHDSLHLSLPTNSRVFLIKVQGLGREKL